MLTTSNGSQSASFSYDANGNLISDGATSYTYDIENRLVAASGATSAQLRYDPLGRLHEVSGGAVTTRFLYDNDELVAEYDTGNTLLRRYLHGSGSDDPVIWYEGASATPATRRHLFADRQGSIVGTTDSGGSIIQINRYDEWGLPDAANAGRFGYTGQAWIPELGLWHYKARLYSPSLGRFMQTDPIGYEDGINWYAYVGNDPVNGTDPTGLKCSTTKDEGEDCKPEVPENEEPPIVVTAAKVLGKVVLEIAPGGAAVNCVFISACDRTEKVLAVVDLVPGLGKLGKLGRLRKLSRACGCVVAGTLIATPNGLVAIETLRAGDMVLAYDVAGGAVVPQSVLDVINTEPKPTYNVVLRGASGKMAQFEATADHPWLHVAGQWHSTAELIVGDRLIARDGLSFEVTEIGLSGKIELAYTLTVDEFHTYIMGEAGIVVHNSCPTIKEAQQAFRTDKKFTKYFHSWKKKSGLGGDGAGQRNSDLTENQMLEAYQDWLADGKPSKYR